jgi:hypothetical protein
MMLASTLLLALLAAPAASPSPKPAPKPAPEAAAAPARGGQLANVRIDIKLTDRRGTGEPAARQVSMIVADRRNGMIRATDGPSTALPMSDVLAAVALNVDASPVIEDGNRIRLHLSLEYKVQDEAAGGKSFPVRGMRQNINVVAESGRPLAVADSSDPLGDRRVAVEVTATIVR